MIEKIMKKYALSQKGAKDLVKATAACTASNIILMFPVSLLYFTVNDLMSGKMPENHKIIFILTAIILLILIYITARIQYNATFFSTYTESETKRISLAEKLRKLPLSFFGQKDLSDLTTAVMSDTNVLEQAFSHWIPQFFGAIISTCLIAVGLIFFQPKMAAAALWVLPISLCVVAFSKKFQQYFSAKKNDAIIDCADSIQECLEAVRDLKSNNADEKYLKGLYQKIDKIESRSISAELGIAVFVISASLLLKFGIATTALMGAKLLIGGEITVMTFFMFLIAVSRIYEPMSASLMHLAAINSLQLNIDRMNEITDYREQKGTDSFEPKNYDIVFDRVGFSYNDGENVLKNVSFTAKQGEVTALIGPSGGGKSTAAKLAARFWDAGEGKITVGGIDISKVDPERLLTAYSIVFQDVTLFNNTVMENIRIGRKGASDDEVLQAAKEANCDVFCKNLPEGYNTVIGENGSALSGGERQRISIARALLKDAPIILLDEATASLDAENETQIQQAISRLVKNKTVLIIAHRLRTVEGADKLVLLKDGTVAEQGSPAELKMKNGLYAKMLSLQKQSEEWSVK